MNWFKRASSPVMISQFGPEGITAYIDGKKYRCPGYNPLMHRQIEALIRAGQKNPTAFNQAKNLLRRWPCINEQKEQQQFTNQKADPQLKLF